ncbi:MAG: ParB N-terminal domain-containing protein [Synergistaceae bacterium]|nr:ParB N-terminal domain-containing protein [Synergistaceae bacterium]
MGEKDSTLQGKYEEKKIKFVDVSKLVDFSGEAEATEKDGEVKVSFTNPFDVPDPELVSKKKNEEKTVADKDMEKLIKGIEEFGVMVPLTVRKSKDQKNKYELLSGYRRREAVKFINKNRPKENQIKVPIIVEKDCDDARAKFILANSNTCRSKISLKELIKACGKTYRTKREANPNRSKDEIAKEVGELFNVLSDNVIRYSMLINLNDGLLELIGGENEKGTRKRTESKYKSPGKVRLSRRAGVSLATLNEDQQKILLNVLEDNKDLAISVKMASEIRKKFADKPKMSEDDLVAFIKGVNEEQSVNNSQPEPKPINLNDLLSETDNKDTQKIFGVLKDFLEKWQEAGSPENFTITATSLSGQSQ